MRRDRDKKNKVSDKVIGLLESILVDGNLDSESGVAIKIKSERASVLARNGSDDLWESYDAAPVVDIVSTAIAEYIYQNMESTDVKDFARDLIKVVNRNVEEDTSEKRSGKGGSKVVGVERKYFDKFYEYLKSNQFPIDMSIGTFSRILTKFNDKKIAIIPVDLGPIERRYAKWLKFVSER